MRFYLNTSVIGALLDKELPMRANATRALLNSIKQEKHIGIISNIVLEELDRAPSRIKEELLPRLRELPLEIITEDKSSAELVGVYEKEGFIRKEARLDLRHLAIATIHGVDALVSWNFRDLVNIVTRRAVHSINLRLGLPLIEIISPEEVIEYE